MILQNMMQSLLTETSNYRRRNRETRRSHLSSWHVFLWNARHISFLQGGVYCSDQFINVCSHLGSVGIVLELPQPRSFEVPVLLALDAEQAVLGNLQAQKLDHALQLGEQVPLQILEVDHLHVLPVIEPVQRVRRPPRSVVPHKLGPFCSTNERTEHKQRAS